MIKTLLSTPLIKLREEKLDIVHVAILDTGIDVTHDALKDRIEQSYFFHENTKGQYILRHSLVGNHDMTGHGTSVASILATLAPNVKITSYRVLDDSQGHGFEEVVIRALELAIESDAQIINMSLTFPRINKWEHLTKLLEYAYHKRKNIIVATKNDAHDDAWLPAGLSTCITVDKNKYHNPFTFKYTPCKNVDFMAMGIQVLAAKAGGGYHRVTGSSFATPVISAMAALLLGCLPSLQPFEVKTLLKYHQMKAYNELNNPLELMYLLTQNTSFCVSRRCKVCGQMTELNDLYPIYCCQKCNSLGLHRPLLDINVYELICDFLSNNNAKKYVDKTKQAIEYAYSQLALNKHLNNIYKKCFLLAAACQYCGYALRNGSSLIDDNIQIANKIMEILEWNEQMRKQTNKFLSNGFHGFLLQT